MSQIPSPTQFFLDTPPYREFEIGKTGVPDVLRLQFYTGTLDTFCPECHRESVFASLAAPLRAAYGRPGQPKPIEVDDLIDGVTKAGLPYDPKSPSGVTGPLTLSEMGPLVRTDRVFEVSFACTRDKGHCLYFFFRVWKGKVSKVGQSPSLADLQTSDIKKYRKLLGNDRFLEFHRAIGLHAHGVGVGAFVYLRRIFEDLIAAARREAAKAPGWDQEAFARSRMDEKILLLKDHLPRFLVENRAMYSILSCAIHDLAEDDCRTYFEPVKGGIELILDEKLAQLEREAKTANTAKAITRIKGQIASGRGGDGAGK